MWGKKSGLQGRCHHPVMLLLSINLSTRTILHECGLLTRPLTPAQPAGKSEETGVKDFKGKTAFITGAASGIGLGMARAFGREGMNIVIADIDRNAAQAAAE